MTNDEITKHMHSLITKHGTLDKSLMFDFGRDGVLHIDGEDISNDKKNADCTVKVSKSNFLKIATGKANPMTAIMMGQVRIKGDKSVAMSLQRLFS